MERLFWKKVSTNMNRSVGTPTVTLTGAGYHSVAKESQYRNVCQEACKQAMQLLSSGSPALDAVVEATMILENSTLTNAGRGSCLTLEGAVECDASVMDGSSLQFGAVGAVSGIANPCRVAAELVRVQQRGCLSLGRIPPSILVGDGAYKWAQKQGLIPASHEDVATMITDSSLKTYKNHKRKIAASEDCGWKGGHKCVRKSEQSNADDDHVDGIQDTVGVICLDATGGVVSAVSSGGISLKQPGRIGPAACYGAGCWAYSNHSLSTVAVCTSGTGEQVMKTLLARNMAERLQSMEDAPEALRTVMQERFIESEYLVASEKKFGGILSLKHDDNFTEVHWVHSTDSMCVGYMSAEDRKPTALVSRMPAGQMAGRSFMMQGTSFRQKQM